MLRDIPQDFTVRWQDFTFSLKLMGFKHTGIFPEQAVNWDFATDIIRKSDRELSGINLFGYICELRSRKSVVVYENYERIGAEQIQAFSVIYEYA